MLCTVPRIAFMVITARITIVLSNSPLTMEMIAAAIRMITSRRKEDDKRMHRLYFLQLISSIGVLTLCDFLAAQTCFYCPQLFHYLGDVFLIHLFQSQDLYFPVYDSFL